MARPAKLNEDELVRAAARLTWRDGSLEREAAPRAFRFDDFKRAFGFMASLALAAER